MYIVEDIGSTHFGGVLRKKRKLDENEELVKVLWTRLSTAFTNYLFFSLKNSAAEKKLC